MSDENNLLALFSVTTSMVVGNNNGSPARVYETHLIPARHMKEATIIATKINPEYTIEGAKFIYRYYPPRSFDEAA